MKRVLVTIGGYLKQLRKDPKSVLYLIQGKLIWFFFGAFIKRWYLKTISKKECFNLGYCQDCKCDFNQMAVTNKKCNSICNLKFTKLPIVVADSKFLETRVYTLELEWRIGKTVISEHIKVDIVYTPTKHEFEEYLLNEAQTKLVKPILKDYYVILENRLKNKVKFYLKNEVVIEPRWNF